MITRRTALLGAAIAALVVAAPALAADDLKLPRQAVELVAPPFVHSHEQATKEGPKIIEFKLTIKEKEVIIDDAGTKFQAMTFNGSMPAPMMVVHEGDYVEVTLVNPETNTMPHNIDFHSATGGLGGGALTLRQPRRTGRVALEGNAHRHVRLSLRAGRYDPLARRVWHDGTVMVLPRDGLKDLRRQAAALRPRLLHRRERSLRADRREGQIQELRTPGEAFADTIEVMRKLIPTHVVFNGKVGALTGKNAMTAKVGETV